MSIQRAIALVQRASEELDNARQADLAKLARGLAAKLIKELERKPPETNGQAALFAEGPRYLEGK